MDSSDLKPTILVVDDNLHTLDIVEHALNRADLNVQVAPSGEAGLKIINESGLPHLAVVDLNMPPGMSGFDFCRQVHQFCDLPIIMLTAIDEETTVVKGLEEHVEDYVTKPFNPIELAARIKRVLRRIGDFAYTFEPITRVDERLAIDFPSRQALIDGEQVSLTPIETKLLYILMRSAGRIVTTDFIIRRIWPSEPVYEDRLHVHMHRLRRKIEEKSKPRYILSERGQGYSFRVKMENTPSKQKEL
jgi:DNA-binding response OmpR family regulator